MAISPGILAAQTPTLGGCQVFPANNVWNTRIDNLPVSGNSSAEVNTIGASSPLHPDFGYNGGWAYNTANASTPRYYPQFVYADGSDPGPYPIPANVTILAPPDRHAQVLDTTTCTLYELFSLQGNAGSGWTAGSGAIFHLNSNQLRPDGWTSADAAGLPIVPGLIRYDEVIAGHINHAIRFTVPQSRNTYIWPARHAASALTGTQYPQMGQRFRLKADYDISSFPQHVQVVLQALKTYGMIVADNGAPWFVSGLEDSRWNDDEMHQLTRVAGADFEAVDESSLQVSPDSAEARNTGAGTTAPAPTDPSTNVPTGWVNVVSKNSGKCMAIAGAAPNPGADVIQWTCTGGLDQEYQFVPVSGGYKINVRSTGLQIGVAGGPTALGNGPLFEQEGFGGLASQIFTVTAGSDGLFTIKPTSSGSCLDVSDISRADGAAIHQWSCWGGDNQKWSFAPAS